MYGETDPAARGWFPALAIPVFLVLCGLLSYFSSRPPRPLDESADPSLFSACRAAEILESVAAHPHPIGSPMHDRVRDLLLERLRALTDEASVQRCEVISDYRRRDSLVAMATVENLVAKLRGAESRTAVLLMAHYDSTPASPGAADDGSGVASILETLRALRQGPKLRNDVIVLLSDGEEAGLLGAQAFFREHPWREDVRLVLNLEARGSRGPVMLFETSPGNGWLISELAKASYHPLANSLAYEAYKRMPNDTDLSIAKRAGYAGLNFAFTEGFYDYHSAGDSLDHLSLASLQEMGDTALSLTRRFGNLELNHLEAPDVGYFNPAGRWMLRYPFWLYWIFLGVFTILFVAVVARGSRARRVSLGSASLGAGAFLILLILFLEISAIVQGVVRDLAGTDPAATWKMVMSPDSLLTAQFLLGISVYAVLVGWIHRGIRLGEAAVIPAVLILGLWWVGVFLWPLALVDLLLGLALYLAFRRGMSKSWGLVTGALLVWVLGFVLLATLVPGSAFVCGWPLLFALPACLWAIGHPPSKKGRSLVWFVVLVGVVPAGVLLTDVARPVQMNLGTLIPWAASLPVGLLLGLLLPLFVGAGRRGRWVLGAISALLAVAFFAWPVVSDFDARHRRPAELFFLDEQDGGFWATTDRPLVPWQQEVLATPTPASLSRIIPHREGRLLLSRFHAIQVESPTVEGTSIVEMQPGEKIEFEVHPSAGSARVLLFLSGLENLQDASVNGMPVTGRGASSDTLWWVYSAPPAGGLKVRLEADSLRLASLRVVQITYGWPGQLRVPPRPPTLMSNPRGIPDSTIVVREWKLRELGRP